MKEKIAFILKRGKEIGFETKHLIQYFNKDVSELSSYFIISSSNDILHIVYGLENVSKFTYTNEFECKNYPRRYHNEYLIKLENDEVSVIKSYASSILHIPSDSEIAKLEPLIDILYHALDQTIILDEIYTNNNVYTITEENEVLSFTRQIKIPFKYEKTAKAINFDTNIEFDLIDEELIMDSFYLDLAKENEIARILICIALVKSTKKIILLRVYTHTLYRDDIFVTFYNEVISKKGLYSKVVLRDHFDLMLFKEINALLDVKQEINENIREVDFIVKELERSGVFDKIL